METMVKDLTHLCIMVCVKELFFKMDIDFT